MGRRVTRVCIVVVPRFNMLTLTSFLEPMRIANYLSPEPLYTWEFRSVEAGRVPSSNGMALDCAAIGERGAESANLVAVFGSWGAEHFESAPLSRWLREQKRAGATFVAVELGVYLLARAGLLEGQTVTTHWSCLPGFAEMFPDVAVREQLFVVDSKVLSCAGGSAGLDLSLELMAREHDEQLALEVAAQILHHPRRPATSAQRHALAMSVHADVRAAIALLEANIEEPRPVPRLCRELGVSQRKLERLFKSHTGCTVVQFANLLRLQKARVLLISTSMSIRDVSAACGFNSLSYFSMCFRRTFGRKPSEYRLAWPEQDPAPSWPGTVYAFKQGHQGQKGKAG